MKMIASERILFESPSPTDVFCYTPYLAHGFDGRLIASFDLGGPGVKRLSGPKSDLGDFGSGNQAKIFISDDHGATWRHTADLPMLHGRAFPAGKRLYFLGHSGRLLISASDDNGEHWSEAITLDSTRSYHQSGCTIDDRHGKIYLVMERPHAPEGVTPVLMCAEESADLTKWENWRLSDEWNVSPLLARPQPFGIPFYPVGELLPGKRDPRYSSIPFLLETNVLRIYDPQHLFYDPADRTVVLLARLQAGNTNMAMLLRGREAENGTLAIDHFTTPAGTPFLFCPLPGGHMKFQIVYDDKSRLYWLISTQSTDSVTRPECLDDQRFNLPNNERRRLVLHFSKNLIDWCFAGVVAIGEIEKASRHYASLLIDNDNLLILSRSGDTRARSAHNGNLITFHQIPNFRSLVY